MNKGRKQKSYQIFAERAAELEKQGAYRHASPLWYEASLLARRKENQEYAKVRSDFCAKFASVYSRPVAHLESVTE